MMEKAKMLVWPVPSRELYPRSGRCCWPGMGLSPTTLRTVNDGGDGRIINHRMRLLHITLARGTSIHPFGATARGKLGESWRPLSELWGS
jgi:hypothetical protein